MNHAEPTIRVTLLIANLIEARAQLAERDLETAQLKAQIDKLKRMQFGRKCEQLDRQIARLETQLESLAGERGVAEVRRACQSSASTPVGEASPKQALPQATTPARAPLADFLASLGTAWQDGEVRATHHRRRALSTLGAAGKIHSSIRGRQYSNGLKPSPASRPRSYTSVSSPLSTTTKGTRIAR